MSNDLARRPQLPARVEKPWERFGQRGAPCQVLFDPERCALWVKVGDAYHPVDNLAVRQLDLRHDYYEDPARYGGFGGPMGHATLGGVRTTFVMDGVILPGREGA